MPDSRCGDVKFPGVFAVLASDGEGRVIARWRDDQDSDYRVERAHPMLCLYIITRLGYRIDVPSLNTVD